MFQIKTFVRDEFLNLFIKDNAEFIEVVDVKLIQDGMSINSYLLLYNDRRLDE